MKRRFTIEKTLVSVVRYFQTMYVIRDDEGNRLYTGSSEKKAREIRAMLSAYYVKRKIRKQRKRRRNRK